MCRCPVTPQESKASERPVVLQHTAVDRADRDSRPGEAGKRQLSFSIPPPTKQRKSLWGQRLQDHFGSTPELETMCQQWESRCPGKIIFKLPPVDALAGSILQHSSEVLESTCASEKPIMFKIGFTHNPFWRWSNNKYGYAHAREQWSHMIVLHISSECHSVSMLEAALIDKYKSTLPVVLGFFI